MLLNIITGNIDRKGGVCLGRSYDLEDFAPLTESESDENAFEFFQEVNDRKRTVDLYFSYMNNPVYEYPDLASGKDEVLRRRVWQAVQDGDAYVKGYVGEYPYTLNKERHEAKRR